MRYLNKIVFLNSAHIPYSEIQLDGNVHFIGTQGVERVRCSGLFFSFTTPIS